MANGMASITILGTLGADAETRQAGGTTATGFRMAVNTRRGRDEVTDWYSCTIWGTRGEKLAQHLTRGSQVCVSGEFSTREYESRGEKRTSLEINVQGFAFAGGKRDDDRRGNDGPPPPGDDYGPAGGGFGDDDIPF